MQPGRDDELRLAEKAGHWFGLLQDGNEHRESFFRWLEESPRNVEEMLEVMAVARAIGSLSPEARARLGALDRDQEGALPGNVVTLPVARDEAVNDRSRDALSERQPQSAPSSSSQSAWRRWFRPTLLVAGIVLGLGVGFVQFAGGERVYATDVGEQRVIELTDGSVIHLNTHSRVSVELSDRTRRIRLLEGQALFEVARDTKRPFLVETDAALIQALGTQFDVYRRDEDTRVAVIEGVVQVSPGSATAAGPSAQPAQGSEIPVRVGAGEAVDVTRGAIKKQSGLDVVKVTAWRQRRLVFSNDTLADIATEFNRYNPDLQIRVIGDALAQQTFSGTFPTNGPDALMRALAMDEALVVERSEHEIIIRPR
jgi:transmembrane sensor